MTGRARQIANRLLVVVACLWPTISLAQTTVKYVHTDALGSVVAMTDASGTVVEATREYEPYGQQLSPAMQDGPGYTGHVQDAATGLTYMQQRYYDPGIGRFLSVDPVTAYSNPVGAFNRYWYANNNPYTFTDPDGRQSKAASKQLGRVIRAAWESRGDPKKFDAKMAEYKAQDRMVLDATADFTAVGPVKDAIEVSIKVASGEDATGQGAGAVAGEVADQVTQKVLDGKIGGDAAEAVGAAVGKAVGDTVEAVVDHSRGGGPAGVESTPAPDPVRPTNLEMRDKIGDK